MKILGRLSLLSVLTLLSACRFYEVDEGKFYRVPQMKADAYEKIIKNYGIKTILNLRGRHTGKQWYDEEVDMAERNGVHHVSIRMSAQRLPHQDELRDLITALEELERPILVHCRGGADRTGLASALYKMMFMEATRGVALGMLVPHLGHVMHLLPKGSPQRFLVGKIWEDVDWAMNDYDPCDYDVKFYDREKYCDL